MRLLLRWAASAAAVGFAAWLLPGIEVRGGTGSLFAFAALLGLANAVVRPVLRFLSCGLIALTLGLFLLVINAAILLLTARAGEVLGIGVWVDGWGAALAGALVIGVATWLASLMIGDGD